MCLMWHYVLQKLCRWSKRTLAMMASVHPLVNAISAKPVTILYLPVKHISSCASTIYTSLKVGSRLFLVGESLPAGTPGSVQRAKIKVVLEGGLSHRDTKEMVSENLESWTHSSASPPAQHDPKV